MSLQVVLIFGNDPAQAPELIQNLEMDSLVSCRLLETLYGAHPLIVESLPDLIFVFADVLESQGEDVSDFCRSFRDEKYTTDHRPTLVVHTGTSDEKKRIEYLISGADDTLFASVGTEELRVRLLAHLRRNLDMLSNRVTRLPGLEVLSRILQRRIFQQDAWALMAITLEHFQVYTEVYGNFSGEQVLKNVAAMLWSLIRPPDFVGHSENETFFIITHPSKVEKMASLLCRQFDTVAPNFYSDRDKRRGYVVSVVDDKASRRVPLLTLSIGIVTSQTQSYDSYKTAFTTVFEMRALSRMSAGSNWVSDRLKLTGSNIQSQTALKKSILVVESDAALAFLLKTTLEMQGYEVETSSDAKEALEVMDTKPFQLVLMDAVLNNEPVGFELCKNLKALRQGLKVIFISSIHDRENALSAGADLYMPKPFDLIPLFSWIDRLLSRS